MFIGQGIRLCGMPWPMSRAFNPANYGQVVSDWDVSDISQVSLNGDYLSALDDKSGNGRTLSQSLEPDQFRYTGETVNGIQACRNDGTQFMKCPKATWGSVGPADLVCTAVLDLEVQAANAFLFYGTGESPGQADDYVTATNVASLDNDWGIWDGSWRDAGAGYSVGQQIVTHEMKGAQSRVWVSGAPVGVAFTTVARLIDGDIYVGANNADALHMTGSIGQLIMHEGPVNVPGLHAALNKKWGSIYV